MSGAPLQLLGVTTPTIYTMVKKRVLDPIPVFDEALLTEALREEGIKEVGTCLQSLDQKKRVGRET